MDDIIKNLHFFKKRREKLVEKIENNSIVILPSSKEILRNGDAHYSFRQSSNFYYLTGFHEPSSLAVLVKSDNNYKFIMFVRPKDPLKEQWDGKIVGIEDTIKIYQADESHAIDDLEENIVNLLKNKSKIYYSLGSNAKNDSLVLNWLNKVRAMQRTGVSAPDSIVNIDSLLSEMRLYKDSYEIDTMRKAAEISAAGHILAMKNAKNCQYEYQVEAELQYELMKHGARKTAYTSIVGSGKNSCILHYVDNNMEIDDNDLILIDAGAEYNNYAADITRTFPTSGKFSVEQKLIYELVLKAQLAAIDEIKPGNTWERAQAVILDIITSGLVDLGLIANPDNLSIEELIQQEKYLPFYMHKSGHWLGLDVHDVGSYKVDNNWRKLEAGMVLTVEPGIYIMPNMPGVDKKWWNIGVRIEDDILVTEHGHDILSKDAPKQIPEIESLMA